MVLERNLICYESKVEAELISNKQTKKPLDKLLEANEIVTGEDYYWLAA